MKGKLAVSRLSGGLRAIFLLIYWSLPIKGFFNTQALSVTSWSNNFWCFRIDFCLTIKCSVRSINVEKATCAYFFGFQRTDKVNRNYLSSVEKRRVPRSCHFQPCFRSGQSFLCRREGVGHVSFFLSTTFQMLFSPIWYGMPITQDTSLSHL